MRPAAIVRVCLADGFAAALAAGATRIVVADAVAAPRVDGIETATGADVAGAAFEVLAGGLEGDALLEALLPFALQDAPRPAVGLAAPVQAPAASGDFVVFASGEDGVTTPGVVVVGEGADDVLAWWRKRALAFEDGPSLDAALARFPSVTLAHEPVTFAAAGRPEPRAGAAETPAARDLAHLPDGTPLDARLRALFRDGVRAGDLTRGPFDEPGATAFLRWLAEADARAEMAGIPRILAAYWEEHANLRDAYPDLLDADQRAGYLGWIAHHGADTLDLPPAALPDLPSPAAGEPAPQLGVNVAGYFNSEAGVGEAARRIVKALDAARIPVMPVQGDLVPPTRRGEDFAAAPLAGAAFDVNLVCVNADGLPHFASEAGSAFFEGRYTIGLWWWELPTFPARFQPAVAHVDEIWVGSRYVQDALSPAVTVPVVRMPLPVEAPTVGPRSREQLGLPEGFLLLFMFDFHSVMERKNPLGLIDAFARAFAPGDGAALVIKTINAEHHPDAARRLADAAASHPDVHVVDRFVSAAERDAMLVAADGYVSLHRSEGFGLTIAEALALGKPVIATDYAGSADFMDARSGWPVPYTLVPVGPGNAPYDADAEWAQPDLEAAARAMRELRADPAAARSRGAAAAARIAREHAPTAVGEAMRRRLEALRPAVEVRGRASLAPARVGGRTRLRAIFRRDDSQVERSNAHHAALTATALAETRRLQAQVDALHRRHDT